jgi:hypothetical protein
VQSINTFLQPSSKRVDLSKAFRVKNIFAG